MTAEAPTCVPSISFADQRGGKATLADDYDRPPLVRTNGFDTFQHVVSGVGNLKEFFGGAERVNDFETGCSVI